MGCDLQEHAWGREFPLIGIRLASPHHADLVVRRIARAGLLHDADRARERPARRRSLAAGVVRPDHVPVSRGWFRRSDSDGECDRLRAHLSGGRRPTLTMAAQAFRIVEGSLAHSRPVGIMAGEAAHASIRAIPAAAVFEPIRLESDVIDAANLHRLDH